MNELALVEYYGFAIAAMRMNIEQHIQFCKSVHI